jgi:hypothetical protein
MKLAIMVVGAIAFAAFAVIAMHKRTSLIRPIWGECWSGPIWEGVCREAP